ncbi:uncharacterized protein Myd88 isoform X2 [Cherax quadricarinatus]
MLARGSCSKEWNLYFLWLEHDSCQFPPWIVLCEPNKFTSVASNLSMSGCNPQQLADTQVLNLITAKWTGAPGSRDHTQHFHSCWELHHCPFVCELRLLPTTPKASRLNFIVLLLITTERLIYSPSNFQPWLNIIRESHTTVVDMSVRRGEVAEAPIRILSSATRQHMATRLDSRKILLASRGVHRDWRGLAEQANLDVSSISCWGKISPTEHCLHIWGQKGGTMMQLWTFLEAMDRFDVIDDTLEIIYSDYDRCMSHGGGALAALPPPLDQLVSDVSIYDKNILTVDDHRNLSMGLGLQHYAALVLFADEDIDFVQEMVEKLEGDYGLKLCLKDRDLVGGLQFESDSIVRLIIERCTRVIAVLSPEFLASSANNFFILFAHALSVDQRRRIVIPCLHKPCAKPAVISFCHSLDYYRAKGYWNYWEKLRDSLTYQPQIASSEPRARIREVSGSSTSSQGSANFLSIATPSPTQSPSFFSKFLRRSDVKGKIRTNSTSLEDSNQTGKISLPENEDLSATDEQKSSLTTNGYPCSSAIPILETPAGPVLQLDTSSASGESSDYTGIFQRLPDVPETTPEPTSPMSTTSSAAFLIPEESSQGPQLSSRLFRRIFKVKQKKKKILS